MQSKENQIQGGRNIAWNQGKKLFSSILVSLFDYFWAGFLNLSAKPFAEVTAFIACQAIDI